MNSAAGSALNNYNDDRDEYRRTLVEQLMDSMMEKRTAGVQNIVTYLSQHRTDSVIQILANDMIQMGQTIMTYIGSGASADLNAVGAVFEDYALNNKKNVQVAAFSKLFIDDINSGSTRRSFYD